MAKLQKPIQYETTFETYTVDGPCGKTTAPFYVMPRFEGSLRSLLKKGIPPAGVLSLFSQILDGVEAAHLKDVIHRDLNPENILYRGSSLHWSRSSGDRVRQDRKRFCTSTRSSSGC